ncbi:hypothetical protein BBO99_00000935 [Phytophthora kernoviae]|uniref:NFACT RNA-binding domain-containing protein n=2 Tax=Phytophthora kernoviae TaxID=325452 RepID=A0A3R7GT17_9STRA|nr:hypothetical protein G195_002408 [Phytophthora kernoviae 00238/432]KAG2531666.1 hypothetical protein JM16_000735 [Phytophthora kernoviae]KAG2532957.1 hypothetical protein JM18_000817 [Phytophthora kernoviae]RLN37722.1 hypothetical protein BBI17_000837 [Phytophthora kernoviae]RLN84922.1 hypothetical protein BBO99_00000935 [Phytophthora kernoviae]
MVFYYTSSEGCTIYMGKDKFENEDLIRYGFLEDIWFHVDDLSSAHVYLRLPLVRYYKVDEKDKAIIKALNKTKTESYPDLEEERRQRELLYKVERKKQRLQLEATERKAKEQWTQQKELRSYSTLMTRNNIETADKLEASADLSSVNAYEEDFM